MRAIQLTLICKFLTIILLAGCATLKEEPEGPVTIEKPKQGQALVYLFRPKIDKVGRFVKATLLVDGVSIAALPFAAYTILTVEPGRHQFAWRVLRASNPLESSTPMILDIAADEVRFVALWNPDQPPTQAYSNYPTKLVPISQYILLDVLGTRAPPNVPNNGMTTTQSVLFDLLAPTILAPSAGGTHASGLQFELVDLEVAQFGLAGLRKVAAVSDIPARVP
jgi:hypothetical protein